MVLSTQWHDRKVLRSSSDSLTGLGTQVSETSFKAGSMLSSLYICPSNFGPNKATRTAKLLLELS